MKRSILLLGALACSAPAFAFQEVVTREASSDVVTLKVGAKAPALVVSDWVKGEAVSAFQPGRTYVVEFWATWCGPCIASIPHLTKLQKRFSDKLTVIGVSCKDPNNSLEQVSTFVASRGDAMGYAVAFDEAEAARETWMEAADQDGIPCSFVVDPKGNVAWIGHPMWLDIPVAKITAGTWDPVAGARELEAIQKAFGEIYEANGPAQSLERIAAFEKAYPEQAEMVAAFKFDCLLGADKLEEASTFGNKLADHAIAAGDAMLLNQISWGIVDPEQKRARRDLALAQKAAVKAVELTQRKDAAILDTLARVHFLKGELKEAVAVQAEAVGLEPKADGLRATLNEYQGALDKAAGKATLDKAVIK